MLFRSRTGGYTLQMFLNYHAPIAAGRELWGFPKKLAEPTLKPEIDTLTELKVSLLFANVPSLLRRV